MKKVVLIFTVLVVIYSCKQTSEKSSEKIFQQLESVHSGINFSNNLVETDSLNYLNYAYMYMGGGVAAGDINNDGLIDLYFTGNMVPNKLYLNKGDLTFEDISESAGVAGDKRWFTGVTMADVNNDGYLDIYCSVGGKYKPKENLLFINNGDLTFTEKAEEYGLADVGNGIQATFFDYDVDGDLDVYIANYPPTKFDAPNNFYAFKMANTTDVETDKLFRNDNGTFTNVTDEAGLRSFGLTNSVTVGDLNNDGWPDIYISNDFSVPDYLFINNKNGTFSEEVQALTDQTAQYGMGVDIADFNNDLLLDIVQTDMTPGDNRRSKANMASMNPSLFWGTVNAGFGYQYMQNMLNLNRGMLVNDSLPKFSNISRMANMATTDWSWGPLFADLDNDGWKDLFISNGTRREINNKDYFKKLKSQYLTKDSLLSKTLEIPSEKIDNYVFRNNRDLTFSKVNEDWGIEFKGFSNGCVYADLDNDGDLEIVTNNIDDKAAVFKNNSSDTNNFITLTFKGPENNKFGLGVRAILTTDQESQLQEMTLTRGFQSSVAPQLHFGLGKKDTVDHIEILWPDGQVQQLTDVANNQFLEIKYTDAVSKEEQRVSASNLLFETEKDTTLIVSHRHYENMFDDFQYEVLLPHRTSTFSPGLAVGDLNGDGLDDFIITGSSQYETCIYIQQSQGFKKLHVEDLANDTKFEDMGALIFDADNDGDNDIYMISGGNEFDYDSEFLQDRLYINNGKGSFTEKSDALPTILTSGSRAYNFDYDGDGDQDLFVAGRLIPRNYPSPADSYILENVSTNGVAKFNDVTDEIAPELRKLGLVTSAIWSDYDNDGATDLILAGEWMPITIFRNTNGTFKNVTSNVGLADSTGWWFSLQQGDFDNDGDIDFIGGNLGLNYKYKANEEETFDIYFNDFDQNSKNDIVLSYYNDGEQYPVRGRECSSQQIPAIKKKFENYESFANASLVDVYTEQDLEKSLHYQVRTFATSYIENDNGNFVLHSLPNLAQLSSVNQIIVDDFNNDKHLDIIIAGNLYGSEVETPRNDAGTGLFLKGDGKGDFLPVTNYESGLYIPGDVKDMAKIRIRDKNYLLAAKNEDYLEFVRMK